VASRPEVIGSSGMSGERPLSLAERRERFQTNWARDLAEEVADGPVRGFTKREAGMGLSGRLCWFSAPGRLVVVAGPYQRRRDVDLALAFGLRHVKLEERLVLVMPEEEAVSRATLVRAPWIDRPLEVWTYDLAGLERGLSATPVRRPLESRGRVLQRYTEDHGWGYGTTPPRPDDYRVVLGDQSAWVVDLATWIDIHPDLDAEHTKNYAAWKCAGKIVLKIQKSRGELTLTAGIQYSDPRRSPSKVRCSGALSEDELSRLTAAVNGAVEEMIDGMGGLYPEHRLQATIARQEPAILGLKNLVAECPAWRPYERPHGRAFLDFLGVDEKGTLHVLEAKVGGDVMMVLQGLDYWIWVTANRNALAEEFSLGDRPKVEVDFLVSEKGTDEWLGPYSGAQSRALAPEVVHRFWKISNWDHGTAPVIELLDA